MSFPALAATIPLRFAPSWLSPQFEVYREHPLILLHTDDFVFFAAVGALWYWIGAKADRYFGADHRRDHSKTVNVGLAATGFLLSLGAGLLATYYTMLTDAKPFRQIGRFGLVWSAMLLVYFSWKLVCLYKASAPNHA
jgi:hypothetical protein